MSRWSSLLVLVGVLLNAVVAGADTAPPLSLRILSSHTLNGTAGDYVTVHGTITDTGDAALSDITTYLSLVDTEAKLPVDLEDWSAEKGQYIGSMGVNQTLPLDWKIHFVKAGNYSLTIVAQSGAHDLPCVSPVTRFVVLPKVNLNPANVLPVAFLTPLVLLLLLFLATRIRKVEE